MGASIGNKGFVSDINVTPFVDVMLVLLIIFMVTAPMMTEGLDVELPQTQAVETLPTDSDHVVLTITKDSGIIINNIPTTLDTLAQQLVTVVKEPGRPLFLQADKEVPYGVVVGVMGRIKAAGIEQMGIVAERIDDIAAVNPALPGNQVAPGSAGTLPKGQPSGKK
ncbi:ExbD/TolR family protein [Desulfovibrio sp. OttesenSCG-928-G15]|nr:ExbD/TolR family protein [Desulfovibrio sp. OttesenSCG-928-G15]